MKNEKDPKLFLKHLHKLLGETPRQRALKSGELRSITELAQQNGFLCPVEITAAAWRALVARPETPRLTNEDAKRIWDALSSLRFSARGSCGAALIGFQVVIIDGENHYRAQDLKAVCGPGEMTPTVITIMLPNEDPAHFANDSALNHITKEEI